MEEVMERAKRVLQRLSTHPLYREAAEEALRKIENREYSVFNLEEEPVFLVLSQHGYTVQPLRSGRTDNYVEVYSRPGTPHVVYGPYAAGQPLLNRVVGVQPHPAYGERGHVIIEGGVPAHRLVLHIVGEKHISRPEVLHWFPAEKKKKIRVRMVVVADREGRPHAIALF